MKEAQIQYAARDAIASLAVCLSLVADTHLDSFTSECSSGSLESLYAEWARTAHSLDTKFRMPQIGNKKGILSNETSSSRSKIFVPSKPTK